MVTDLSINHRYCNMDYILLSSLMLSMVLYLLVLYDIACQFSKKFTQRMATYPSQLQVSIKKIRWAIPKKHIAVHGPDHSRFSLNFLRWVARTYGEGVEVGWFFNNPLSGATMEMGMAMRHEVLDDHWNAWNWSKTVRFGLLFIECNNNLG